MQSRVYPERLNMPVKRHNGRWIYDDYATAPNGRRLRIKGRAPKLCNTSRAAEDAMRMHRELIEHPERKSLIQGEPKPVVLFSDWFKGRFWQEWVIGEKNKPTEIKSKENIYECHLKEEFGHVPIDEIDTAKIAVFRAKLVEKGLSEKRINNILAVLSKALHYALDVEVIEKMPRIGSYKIEPPEIEPWSFEEYPRILAAARLEGPDWYAAVCLAGEQGLRSGEIKALDWCEHIDLVADTVMVKRQTCYGVTTTPKGRTRRGIPLTTTTKQALLALPGPREGYVIRNVDGSQKTDGQFNAVILRICARAGLPLKRWHRLRHTFGTDAARFGVNPWTLQSWMGHKRLEETQRYVHVARDHKRPIPPHVLAAGAKFADPDERIIAMLGARVPNGTHLHLVPPESREILAT